MRDVFICFVSSKGYDSVSFALGVPESDIEYGLFTINKAFTATRYRRISINTLFYRDF